MANTAPKKEPGTRFYPVAPAVAPKPRKVGLTHVLDRLHGFSDAELAAVAPYIDVVKFGWGLPLLVPRVEVRRRLLAYHRAGIEVSTGGTLLEYAVTHGRIGPFLDESRELGFDLVEISDGIIELPAAEVERIRSEAADRSLGVFIEVGKKNPQNQLSLRETLERIGRALALRPRKVILESRESGLGVGIYDSNGGIKWDWVRNIVAEYPVDELIFEAPLESQQIALLQELGAETNLGNVALDSVAPLASQRLGLRGDTFGTLRSSKTIEGPPATKFLYFLLETYRALDQSELIRLSRLPRRTVQSAIEELRRQGLVVEGVSPVDSRRREYRLA